MFKDYLESIGLYQPIDTDVFDDLNNLPLIIEESKRIPSQSDDPVYATPAPSNTVSVTTNPYAPQPVSQMPAQAPISPVNDDDTVSLTKLSMVNPGLVPFSNNVINPAMINPRNNPTPRFMQNYQPPMPVFNNPYNAGFVNPNTAQMYGQFQNPVNPNQGYGASPYTGPRSNL